MVEIETLAARGGFPLPVLLVHGSADPLVPTETSAFAGAYPSVERRVSPDVRTSCTTTRRTGRGSSRR